MGILLFILWGIGLILSLTLVLELNIECNPLAAFMVLCPIVNIIYAVYLIMYFDIRPMSYIYGWWLETFKPKNNEV